MDEKALAEQMIDTARETKEALELLANAIQDCDGALEEKMSELQEDVKSLSRTLVGETGDNGLTTRVLLLEKRSGWVSLHTLGVIIALIIAAMGLFVS